MLLVVLGVDIPPPPAIAFVTAPARDRHLASYRWRHWNSDVLVLVTHGLSGWRLTRGHPHSYLVPGGSCNGLSVFRVHWCLLTLAPRCAGDEQAVLEAEGRAAA